MHKLFMKEVKLASHPLSFLFVIFSLMFLVPGYPILCAPFFVTLGLFQSFQKARENGDILFTVLLPISKKDVVKGKFIFILFIELGSTFFMTLCVILRGTVLAYNPVYLTNKMMRADFFALSLALMIFALFNFVFVKGFFYSAYSLGVPFLLYSIFAFLLVGIGELLSHFSFMHFLDHLWNIEQFALIITSCILYSIITLISYRMSVKRFEKLDL